MYAVHKVSNVEVFCFFFTKPTRLVWYMYQGHCGTKWNGQEKKELGSNTRWTLLIFTSFNWGVEQIPQMYRQWQQICSEVKDWQTCIAAQELMEVSLLIIVCSPSDKWLVDLTSHSIHTMLHQLLLKHSTCRFMGTTPPLQKRKCSIGVMFVTSSKDGVHG